jgi:hypothetical protein
MCERIDIRTVNRKVLECLIKAGACDSLAFGTDVVFEATGPRDARTLTRRRGLFPVDAAQTHDHKVVFRDFDQDGDNDAFVTVNNDPYASAQNRLMRNRVDEGAGFVAETGGLARIRGDVYDVDAGDLDGDGDDDVVTSVCFNTGDTSSEVVLKTDGGALVIDDDALPAPQRSCAVGTRLFDIDDDGDLDALWTGTLDDARDLRLMLRIYVNRGDGTFVDASAHGPPFDAEAQGNHLDAGDLDGDGDVDLVISAGAPYRRTDLPGAVRLLGFTQGGSRRHLRLLGPALGFQAGDPLAQFAGGQIAVVVGDAFGQRVGVGQAVQLIEPALHLFDLLARVDLRGRTRR